MDMYKKRKERKEKAISKSDTQGEVKKTDINWYPGHMAKTMKQIELDLKLIDIIIEILDARIPISSQNPEVQELIKNKKKIVILNKSDLADEYENRQWIKYFAKRDIPALLCNSNNGDGISKIEAEINKIMQDEKAKASDKGRIGKIIRAMILGIPNVGKSSLINKISKKTSMQVGNKPGVTKQKQWIRLSNNIELLDTPGVLWPKLGSQEVAFNLAFTGTIKTEILEETEIAYNLTKYMIENYRTNLADKYKLDNNQIEEIENNNEFEENEKVVEVMNLIGKSRGAIIRGGEIDLDRASKLLLDDFKNGKLGRITLEKMEEESC